MSRVRRFIPVVCALGLLAASVLSSTAQELSGPPVGLIQHSQHGTILTDRQGLTLYTWEGDVPGTSRCADACATAWPPALVDEAGLMALLPGQGMEMAMSHTGLGAVERADGGWQLAFNGWPLYRFQRDVQPGDANGQGSMGFGARWAVVSLQP